MEHKLHKSYIVAFASGKGGVGKSLATVNTAEILQSMGYRVAILDADLGLSNCATLLNETTPGTVMDIMRRNTTADQIIQKTESGITLVTGADEPSIDHIDWSVLYPSLDQILRRLRSDHDFVLIDTPAGASDLSFWALDRADLGLLVVVGEPTAIADVYRFCKFVLEVDPAYPFAAIINFANDEDDAREVLDRFNSIVDHFMNRRFPYLGFIPMAESVRQSVTEQVPFVRTDPDGTTTEEVRYIAEALVGLSKQEPAHVPVTVNS